MKARHIGWGIVLLCLTLLMMTGCLKQNYETLPLQSNTKSTSGAQNETLPQQSTSGTQNSGQVAWTMRAMLVTPDGQIQEQFEITVDDIILNTDSNTMSLALDIRTPETFRYVFEVPDTGYPVISGKTDGLPYYVWMGYSFDRSIGDYSWGSYALCMEQEYLIMNWNDDESLFLVASRDTEIAPSAILAYFQGYLDLYAFDSAPTNGEINWRMDTKMVTSDGQLISNGTMRMEGSIVKQEDANDLLLLNLSLPNTLHYRFTDHSQDEEGFYLVETELPYYVSMGYCYNSLDNAHVFSFFALDAEMGYLIIAWDDLPGQFLIASRDTEADPAVILAYFQDFLDLFAFDQ